MRNSTRQLETERHVDEFCAHVLVANQQSTKRFRKGGVGLLGRIDFGASAAESERQSLDDYFVKTAEYARALKAEGSIIVGRKGSGKTAIGLSAARELSRDPRSLVLDLRPSAHNLSDLREQLQSAVGQGLFDHTIASFWQYVILLEILLALRERALKQSRTDFRLQEEVRKIEDRFSLTREFVSGDFTSRLDDTVTMVMDVLRETPTADDVRERITNGMYESIIPDLRDAIQSLSRFFEDISIVLDDLDKGWPPRKLEEYDIKMLRHLIEVLKRVQRDFRRKDVDLKYMLLIRSDVYDNLVEETSDRGKDIVIKVDWSDRDQLKHVLRERLISNFEGKDADDAWDAFDVKMSDGRSALDHLIDASLFRPRFLIEVAERVLSFAVNRGHVHVLREDVEKAVEQMSLYLVSDFSYEMRNIAGTPAEILYAFLGTTELLTHDEVVTRIKSKWDDLDFNWVVELLIWYGFLGVVGVGSEPVFIYERAYDFRRLLAERPVLTEERLYAVNPAFIRGLQQP